MFLRNERGLGVKNGTLGSIEEVSAKRMAVATDDGRTVAFDLKDYAHVDHGYAATFHKSQGVTVDQAHVLATPGMDRHSAYVGLSRHRDSVQLHYGRDDFTDQRQLTRTLSRDRAKDMASDYERADPAQSFAERRGITFRARDVAVEQIHIPDKVLDRINDIILSVREPRDGADGPEREGSLRPAPAPDRLAERARRQSPLEQAVDRYARAYQSIDQHRREGLPVLDMQRQEMRDAGQQLDQVRDGMKDLLRSTLQHDPATARAMTELSGRERVAHVIDGMKRENAALQDPNVRAERFVNRWQELDGQRQKLRGWQHDEARGKVESQMSGLAKSLERDPQAESIVRNRSRELGIKQELRQGQSIGRELQDEMARGQRLSRGIGMGM